MDRNHHSFSNNDNTLSMVDQYGVSMVYTRVVFDNSNTDPIILDEDYYQNASRDSFRFCLLTSDKKIILNGDILRMNVQYGGGCREHEFVLIESGEWLESSPVGTTIVLSHNANNDTCELGITEQLAFDLSPLKEAWQDAYQQNSGTIGIHLDGFDEPIFYEF